ncbi:hypothetical protein LTR67_011023 [Exophiala xenobiotica]
MSFQVFFSTTPTGQTVHPIPDRVIVLPPQHANTKTKMSSWSCGRSLTKDQRERKRARDRATKRRRKEVVESSLRKIQTELATLQTSLQGVVHATGRPQTTWSPNCASPRSAGSSHHQPDMALQQPSLVENDTVTPPPLLSFSPAGSQPWLKPASPNVDCYSAIATVAIQDRPTTFPSAADDIRTKLQEIILNFNDDESTSLLHGFNEAFLSIYNITSDQVCTDEQLNQNALIKGVVEGWDSLQCQSLHCPLWDVLRRIDEGLFLLSNTMTRLAMLRAVHFMLLRLVRGSFSKLNDRLDSILLGPGLRMISRRGIDPAVC